MSRTCQHMILALSQQLAVTVTVVYAASFRRRLSPVRPSEPDRVLPRPESLVRLHGDGVADADTEADGSALPGDACGDPAHPAKAIPASRRADPARMRVCISRAHGHRPHEHPISCVATARMLAPATCGDPDLGMRWGDLRRDAELEALPSLTHPAHTPISARSRRRHRRRRGRGSSPTGCALQSRRSPAPAPARLPASRSCRRNWPQPGHLPAR